MNALVARHYMTTAGLVVGLWFVFCIATLDYNGPFFDEGIYITAGQRGLQGYAANDNYLSWFAGSMLWPTLAALGYNAGGLIGARAVATIFATIAFIATVLATQNLFGQAAAFWTALTLALSGPFLALARLAVYDPPALAGIAMSFWSLTMMHRRDHRVWLLLAALAYVFALFSKYPTGLMLLPLIGLTLVLRRGKAVMDMAIFGFIVVAVLLIFYIPLRAPLSQLGTRLAPQEILRQPSLVLTSSTLYFSGLPFVLALLGWSVAKERRLLATVLLLSLALWPAYHLWQALVVGLLKHVVFGFLFGYPLIGLGLSALWERGKHLGAIIAICSALTMVGAIQWQQLDHIWPDVRTAAAYLTAHVQPGDQLLINDSWPYTMYLYITGRIRQPQDVIDIYGREESGIGLCDYHWFVESEYTPQWPPGVLKELQQCGTFQKVFSTLSTVSVLNFSFNYIAAPVEIAIWRNHSWE
ncbi:MAG: ArnT family glycosyltransferase [Anaerolineae bacterium]